MEAGFDHPCKQTCSGWKQGYERGQYEQSARDQKTIEGLLHKISWCLDQDWSYGRCGPEGVFEELIDIKNYLVEGRQI